MLGLIRTILPLAVALAPLTRGLPGYAETSPYDPQTPSYEDGVVLRVKVSDLSSAEGRARVMSAISNAAENYCQGSPPGITTVSACRREIIHAMIEDLQEKVRISYPVSSSHIVDSLQNK